MSTRRRRKSAASGVHGLAAAVARPIARRLTLLVAVFLVVVSFALAVALLALDTLSGIRAWVGGESLWTRSQKQAVAELHELAATGDPASYERFRDHLAVIHGDRRARLELELPQPSFDEARRGLIAGRNHADDVEDMLDLYRRFAGTPLLERAVDAWSEGDRRVAELEGEAAALRAALGRPDGRAEVEAALARIEQIDRDLTALEDEFSATLGEAARFVHYTAAVALVASVLLLVGLALLGSRWTVTRIRTEVHGRARLEESLRQAQRIESLGRLAGGVAHDFNNLMTAIIGYAGLASARAGGDLAQRTQIEEIRRAGERAAELTRQLLAFSQRQLVEEEVLDLNEVVGESTRFLRPLLGEGVELRTDLAPSGLSVRGNRGLIDQVLLNLAVNARDAMPQGGVLRVRTAWLEPVRTAAGPGAPAALLEVEDTGSGMSSEVAAHAVEPFYTTKPESDGGGLGLSTVYGIVRQMGGRLELTSGQGAGTRIRIELPLAAERPAARPSGEARIAPRGRGETILVVEDEATVRRLATELLASKGYHVIEAGSAEDALAVFDRAANGVDLVLSDVVLPGVDGVELMRRLRRSDPALPVLYMTGYAPETLADRGLGGDEAPVLEKPFSPSQLLVAVRSVLNRRARAAGDSRA